MEVKNFYEELNLDESFSIEEIQDELSRLENLWNHRLVSSPEKASAMLDLISDAFEIFKNENSKKAYDSVLLNGKTESSTDHYQTQREDEKQQHFNKAKQYYDSNEIDLAKIEIDICLSRCDSTPNPNDVSVYDCAAWIYSKLGDYTSAISFTNKCIIITDKKAMYYCEKGWFQLLLADTIVKNDELSAFSLYDEAKKTLKKALEVSLNEGNEKNYAWAAGKLAWNCFYTGTINIDEAEKYANMALEADASNEDAQAIKLALEKPRKVTMKELEDYKNEQVVFKDDILKLISAIISSAKRTDKNGWLLFQREWITLIPCNKDGFDEEKEEKWNYYLTTKGDFLSIYTNKEDYLKPGMRPFSYFDQKEETVGIDDVIMHLDFKAYNRRDNSYLTDHGDFLKYAMLEDDGSFVRLYRRKGQGLYNKLVEIANSSQEFAYHYAVNEAKACKVKSDFQRVIALLTPIIDYKKSREIIEACNLMIAKLDSRVSSESTEGCIKSHNGTAQKKCYSFKEGSMTMKTLLGEKGANLSEMTNLGLPVPFGFTITTDACAQFYEDGKKINDYVFAEITDNIKMIETISGKKFSSCANPLFVSIRLSTPVRMPPLMNTILNLGFNDVIADHLAINDTDDAFKRCIYDSYGKFIQTFSSAVKGIDGECFDRLIDEIKTSKGVKRDTDLTADDLKELVIRFKDEYKNQLGEEFPSDPVTQLKLAVEAAFLSWDSDRANDYRRNHGIPYSSGTAVVVMPMVFGNLNNNSGTGVAFTRDPATGAKGLMGEFLTNAQGEDVVAGMRTPMPLSSMEEKFTDVYKQFLEICEKLEKHYCDMQDLEFTVENGKLYMLQCGNGVRTKKAAIKIACDLFDEGLIDEKKAASMKENQ